MMQDLYDKQANTALVDSTPAAGSLRQTGKYSTGGQHTCCRMSMTNRQIQRRWTAHLLQDLYDKQTNTAQVDSTPAAGSLQQTYTPSQGVRNLARQGSSAKSKVTQFVATPVWKLTCHMGSQCYLPPGRGDISAFTPSKAGTRFSDT